ISEPDKGARYSRLAQEFAVSVREGQESVAQISGTREQSVLNGLIRDSLRQEGVLGSVNRIKEHATAGWHRSLPSAYVKGRKAWPKSAG
ncbi:hypothetical protein, partial [Enterobacter hormaechei]|uniref:hypothetical protein n=1 Tax=Enterobacter hormaechei TaxID=158836 RepID=UPI0031379B52